MMIYGRTVPINLNNAGITLDSENSHITSDTRDTSSASKETFIVYLSK